MTLPDNLMLPLYCFALGKDVQTAIILFTTMTND